MIDLTWRLLEVDSIPIFTTLPRFLQMWLSAMGALEMNGRWGVVLLGWGLWVCEDQASSCELLPKNTHKSIYSIPLLLADDVHSFPAHSVLCPCPFSILFSRWWGLDVSDAGGVFDLICEQLDGETLSAKGANRGGRKVFELTKMFQHRNGLGLLFSLETLQTVFSSSFCWSFREWNLLNGCGWRISTMKIRELGSERMKMNEIPRMWKK